MKNGKIRRTLGIILVVVQLISIFSLCYHSVTIWDDEKDVFLYNNYPIRQGLNINELFYGFESGNKQFTESFGFFFKDYDTVRYESGDIITILIRESLGAGENNADPSLFIFDTIVLISYSFVGILGAYLYILGYRAKNNINEINTYIAPSSDKSFKVFKVTCTILTIIFSFFSIVKFYTPLGILFSTSSPGLSIGFIFLACYFIGYFGKKNSALITAAVISVGFDQIVNSFSLFVSLFTYEYDLSEIIIPRIGYILLFTFSGITTYILGIKMYNNIANYKHLLISSLFITCHSFVWPIILAFLNNYWDYLFSISLPYLIFTLIIFLYYKKTNLLLKNKNNDFVIDATAKSDINVTDIKIKAVENDDHKVENESSLYCRKCGVKIPTDSQFCNRCGTKVEY